MRLPPDGYVAETPRGRLGHGAAEHSVRQVNARHLAAGRHRAGGPDGDRTGAAPDVEHLIAGPQAGQVHQAAGDRPSELST